MGRNPAPFEGTERMSWTRFIGALIYMIRRGTPTNNKADTVHLQPIGIASVRSPTVLAALRQTGSTIGHPMTVRVDQGSASVSRDLDLWAYPNGVTLDVARPGKPTDNAYIEAFNGRFQAEWLNVAAFMHPDRLLADIGFVRP